jgi:hypothetical protein
MAIIETEFKRFQIEMRKEMAQLKKIICTRLIIDKWVQQDIACALLHVKKRQLANIRIHLDKEGKKVGTISWKKGAGKNILYYLPDIEKYNSLYTIMN